MNMTCHDAPCIQFTIFFSMQYLRLLTTTSLYSFLMNRSIHSITAKPIKYSLSFSLNLYLRLMETKYNEGMNYASWRLAFCFSKHKHAIHKSKAAYLRQIREQKRAASLTIRSLQLRLDSCEYECGELYRV